jgi:ATP diphosphatase
MTNTKFERRFRWMEEALSAEGKTVAEAERDVMEAAWSKAKSIAGL